MSSANNDSVTSSSPIWMPFISLSCLIAVASNQTSNTMLNRSGESEHPYHFPDLSGKAFSFCPLSMMLAVGFSYMTFIRLNNFLVETIGFSMYTIMLSANNEFYFLLSNLDAFYFLFLSDHCG